MKFMVAGPGSAQAEERQDGGDDDDQTDDIDDGTHVESPSGLLMKGL
jgi:hypothetical protein